jgi:hypothetical protein
VLKEKGIAQCFTTGTGLMDIVEAVKACVIASGPVIQDRREPRHRPACAGYLAGARRQADARGCEGSTAQPASSA